MIDFSIKLTDTLPVLTASLVDSTGAYINLSGNTGILFVYQPRNRVVAPTTGNATILSSGTSSVQYTFPSTVSGCIYYGEFRVKYTNTQQTYPQNGYIVFKVNNNIN